ncbi:TerB family tellurite resistance protein [bacterium]|nr:TerB family tellurite resistance protein [bacterium]
MIIWGSKPITGTLGAGNFNCPVCAQAQQYDQKRVRRFFTLYFIPLFPTSTLGQYVECRSCQGTFEPGVLSYDPAAEAQQTEALFMTAVKQIMIHVCLADGSIDDQEVLQIQNIYEQLTGARIGESDLREEITVISQGANTLYGLIDHLNGQLNDTGKETAIRSAYLIAAADGHVDQFELEMIHRIAHRMGMSPAHLNGVLTTAQQQNLG